MDDSLPKEKIIQSLWNAYVKTPDYRNGLTEAISACNKLVEKQEREGLRRVYQSIVKKSVGQNLCERSVGEWLTEWKEMHNLLFSYVLINRGSWRKKDLYIGDYYDELLKLPPWQEVQSKISEFAYKMKDILSQEYISNESKYYALAEIHYKFIMIHPFDDGNGRIARAITDQISLSLGMTTAMVGYPKHNKKQQELYHRAIYRCAKFNSFKPLAQWIGSYIERQLKQLA